MEGREVEERETRDGLEEGSICFMKPIHATNLFYITMQSQNTEAMLLQCNIDADAEASEGRKSADRWTQDAG